MIKLIDLTKIDANPDQPRKTFDESKLRELANSIEAEGLIQPITVRPNGDRFMIVAGERRFRAHTLLAAEGRLAKNVVLANVRVMSDEALAIQAVVENLQRVDVEPLEEADAFQRLVDGGMDVAEIAKRCGIAPFRIKWRLQLLNLCPEVRGLFASGALDRQQAMEISRLPNASDQTRILSLINKGNLVGWKATRNAVDAIISPSEQSQMFADATPPTEAECKTASAMSARIDRAAASLSTGWKDGECVVACKVDPSEAAKVADKLKAMQDMLRHMERELRNTVGQASASQSAAA